MDVKIYASEPIVLDTIEVRGPSDIICENNLELLQFYFENKKKSDGDTVAKINIDDEASVVYVTFQAEEGKILYIMFIIMSCLRDLDHCI